MMKNTLHKILTATLILSCTLLAGCGKDYLDIIPKGQKVPTTINDYRAFLENIMLTTHADMYQKKYLVNENWQRQSDVVNPVTRSNYLWLEEPGVRINNLQSDYAYTSAYNALFYFNLVIGDVPGIKTNSAAEAKEAAVVVAQARVYRALWLFHLVNTYAKVYDPATAATDNGVPFTSNASDFETAIPQLTVAKIYEIILNDLNTAIPELETTAIHFMLPNKLAATGLRARIHLFMRNFDAALADAETVLSSRNFIFDLVAYHRTYIDPNGTGVTIQDNRAFFSGLPGFAFDAGAAENIWGVGGQTNIDYKPAFPLSYRFPLADSAENINCTRGPNRFEDGDTRFLCNYYRNNTSRFYNHQRGDFGNTGGIRTLELFLIRAECFARKDGQANIDKAMENLDAIRVKRIIASKYHALKGTVSAKAAAMDLVRHERDVELLGTDMMFYDMKRFNAEPEYRRTMTKKGDDGKIYTLKPDSELWNMPFPKAATEKNSNIKQNTSI